MPAASTSSSLARATVISAFCQGDSGGPVLAGRNRGCRRTDKSREFRRYIEGTLVRPEFGSPEMQWAHACMTAEPMAMQDVTIKERRNWICGRTDLEAADADARK
ncbi:hypothetical protein [Bradyrhizobium sp. CCBAU 11430]|uniref:hypothetical protein n=1 Tax=Bradyrhizobium sp. CCBAU 11430 TaxID=1630881 RepID=UPI0023057EB1|nr:hypothetical protein [Bradyrhizobium sp. CCBAU 11430]